MDDPTPEEVANYAEEAVRMFLSKVGNDLATGKFLLVVESINLDGERGAWYAAPSDQTPWESLGLLKYAENMELASRVTISLRTEDDDE